jgi:hypothetical protein
MSWYFKSQTPKYNFLVHGEVICTNAKLYILTNIIIFCFQVQIGCHTDNLYGEQTLDRNPSIVTQFSVKSTTVRASNPWGGLIYITVNFDCNFSYSKRCSG